MSVIFAFPGYGDLVVTINRHLGYRKGELQVRRFSDSETYVKISSEIRGEDVVLVCGLENPDAKAMGALFFAATARELGARRVGLVAPYLGYMRQDRRFEPGEAITSDIFARFVSQHFDFLITVDPHLHRHNDLDEIYTIPTSVVHAAPVVADWISENVPQPVLIGPDEESSQWVGDIASRIDAPHFVLKKVRSSDVKVFIELPVNWQAFKTHTPILVDDIISTGATMIETIRLLAKNEMKQPVCVGIHAIFADDAYEALQAEPIRDLVSCNTIPHPSNTLDVSSLLVQALQNI